MKRKITCIVDYANFVRKELVDTGIKILDEGHHFNRFHFFLVDEQPDKIKFIEELLAQKPEYNVLVILETVNQGKENVYKVLDPDPVVRELEDLSKIELVEFARDKFGVELDPSIKKDLIIRKINELCEIPREIPREIPVG